MLRLLAKLLKALNSETGAWALAFAFVLGMVMGFTPLWRFHNLVILLIALLFRVNLSAFIVSFLVCSALAFALDPLFHQWGVAVLSAENWQPLWQSLYASAGWRVSQFHHSITMGSLLFSLIMAPLVLFAGYWLVTQYRQRVQARFNKLRVVQLVKASKFWSLYESLRG